MTAGPRRLRLSVIVLLAWSLVICAAEAADPVLEHARQQACNLGVPANLAVSIDQHAEGDEADAELVRSGRGWIEDYNAFTNSAEARLLAAYAAVAHEISPIGTYPLEVCRILKPLLAIALSADVLRSRGGQLSGGALISPTKDAVLPPSIHTIAKSCQYQPLQVQDRPDC